MSDRQQDRGAATAVPEQSPGSVMDPAPAKVRRDPFAHGDLPMRPNYLPEEGEGGKSEIWSLLKALGAGVAAILGIAWLLSLLY